MSDDLFAKTKPEPEPEPEPVAPVVQLRPDGISIREDAGLYWVGRRRGYHALCEVLYTRSELEELHRRLSNVLR